MTDDDSDESLNHCFGRTVVHLRTVRGWTQEEFRLKCGLSRQFVSMLERGISSPSLITIARVAAGFEMPEEQFVKIVFDRFRS